MMATRELSCCLGGEGATLAITPRPLSRTEAILDCRGATVLGRLEDEMLLSQDYQTGCPK